MGQLFNIFGLYASFPKHDIFSIYLTKMLPECITKEVWNDTTKDSAQMQLWNENLFDSFLWVVPVNLFMVEKNSSSIPSQYDYTIIAPRKLFWTTPYGAAMFWETQELHVTQPRSGGTN